MKSNMRAARMRRAAGEGMGGVGLEPLEGRQLLTSDLAVAWDTANFRIPAVMVPGDRFDPLGGSNRIEAPIQVANLGPNFAVGFIRIDFYLSADTNLNPGSDLLMRSYPSEALSLDVFTGDPDDIGTFSADMFIPAETAPGSYFLIVRIIPNTTIGDFNTGNNVAVSNDPIVVDRKFGAFSGRTNVVMALKDPEGTTVAFSAPGGGSGTVTPSSQGFGVTMTGTGNLTAVSIGVSGGDGAYDLTFVTINGSVGSFSAPQGRLIGAMTTTVGFGAMTFGDVLGPLTITVPGTSATPSFTFRDVKELSLTSAVGINSITVRSWDDRMGSPDTINAPWVAALTVTQGNFYPNIFLTGRAGGLPTLGPVNINGVVKAGSWVVKGSGGAVSAFATTVAWSATYQGDVASITTGGSFRGHFTAANIGSVSAGKDLLQGKILAGTYLGDDGRLRGSGANADTFGAGTIGTVFAFRNIAGNILAAGLDPVDGFYKNGNDRLVGGTRSTIGNITVQNVIGMVSRILANSYGSIIVGGILLDWTTNIRFLLSTTGPAATVTSADVLDMSGTPTAAIAIRWFSTSLINLDSIASGSVRVTGPNGFDGLCALFVKSLDGAVNGEAGLSVFTVALAPNGNPAPPGTYTISVVPGTVRDVRGNFSPPIAIGTFLV